MIHITKSKTGFLVVNVAKNGEPLATSEVLSSKAKCWKNILAQMKLFETGMNANFLDIQDDTLKMVRVIRLTLHGSKEEVSDTLSEKKYIPGKNKTRK
jgi:uncharacterized protein YegP (UPF0339 family)